MPNWTDEQLAAINTTSQTLLLSAAAGSGKTATLTERLIRLITRKENPLRVSRMLIVTFTRAAAAQLREKIAEALGRALEENPENTFLAEQMLLLPLAKIRTIDSFCNDLVKENADPLGISPSFRIPDGAESVILSSSIMEEVVNDAFCGLFEAEGLSVALLADTLTDVKDDESLAPYLLDLYQKLLGYRKGVSLLEENARALDAAASSPFFQTPWGKEARRLLTQTLSDLTEGYERAFVDSFGEDGKAKGSLAFAENYKDATRKEINAFKALLSLLQEERDYTCIKQAFFACKKETVGKKKAADLSEENLWFKEYRNTAWKIFVDKRDTFFAWDEDELPYAFIESARLSKGLSLLLTEFHRRYMEEKKRRGLCDFSDLSRYALGLLLKENGERTALAEELSLSYDAICIDEYQDVNEIQHLLFEAISTPQNRFMVGDIKQSIYAFRGAQPSIFAQLRQDYEKESDTASHTVRFLRRNFRSKENILSFCNRAFDFLFGVLGKSIHYSSEDDRLNPPQKDKEDAPSLLPPAPAIYIVGTQKGEEENEEEEDGIPYECLFVAKEIERLLREEKKADGTPLSPSDIAILYRQGAKRPVHFSAALARFGIPAFTEDKESFWDKKEVLLALCLLNTVNNPRRDIYLAGLLRSPIYRFSMDDLIRIRRESGKEAALPLFDALLAYAEAHPDFQKATRFLSDLSRFREMAEGMPADKLLRALYTETRLFSYLEEKEKQNLLLLYHYAHRFEAVAFHGLYRFIDHVNSMTEKGLSPGEGRTLGNEKGVYISTIHHAKGLEYPVCFVVGCGVSLKKRKPKESPLVFHERLGVAAAVCDRTGFARLDHPLLATVKSALSEQAMEEELRVLYVALTRPKERLFVTASLGARSPENALKNGMLISRFPSSALLTHYAYYIDWLLGAFSVGVEEKKETPLFSFAVSLAEAQDAPQEPPAPLSEASAPAENADRAQEKATRCEANASPSLTAEELAALFKRRFSFVYPYEAQTRLPRKLSVSRLSPAALDEKDDPITLVLQEPKDERANAEQPKTLPRFLSGKEENPAAKAGSATHIFMQFCDFPSLIPSAALSALRQSPAPKGASHAAITALSPSLLFALVEKEIDRLTAAHFIEKGDADRIYRKEIVAFIRSPLFTAILQSQKMLREFRFHALLPASLFTEENQEALQEETLLVQGVMDLLLFTEDGIILVDYKTDRLFPQKNANSSLQEDQPSPEELLRLRHSPQLTYYKAAVEKIFDAPPKETLIYSLALGKSVPV